MRLIATAYTGSRLFGTHRPDSDTDMAEIYLPSINDLLWHRDKIAHTQIDGDDIKRYGLHRLVDLAFAGNSSVLDLLWSPYIAYPMDPYLDVWHEIQRRREWFLSKEVLVKFRGYAAGEMKEIFQASGDLGAKRKEDLAKFGYIPKKAATVMRLCVMGRELLIDHKLTLPIAHADDIRKVKNGEVPCGTLKGVLDSYMELLTEAENGTRLPDRPDPAAIRHIRNTVQYFVKINPENQNTYESEDVLDKEGVQPDAPLPRMRQGGPDDRSYHGQ